MGIEPFLLIFIVAAMFVVQAVRAFWEGCTDRLEYAEATQLGVRSLVARNRLLPDRQSGGWLAGRQGLDVQVWYDAYPGMEASRHFKAETGLSPGFVWDELSWLSPSVLVVVRLPAALTDRLRIARRTHLVPSGERIPLQNPVLDQLVRATGSSADDVRKLIDAPEVREALMEMLGQHPLSVVTERTVALWCAQPVHDPEPLIELAVELAGALSHRAHRADHSATASDAS